MVCPPELVRSGLACAASILFESTPFLLAGVLLAYLLRRRCTIFEHLGCGCGPGPSARSLPAAAATWMLFGPSVAVARYLAAVVVAYVLRSRATSERHSGAAPTHLLAELAGVFPAAIIAGVALQLTERFDPAHLSPVASAALGAALGFVAAPCGLGAVALAAALRTHAPLAAILFLCVAGIIDFRALRSTPCAPARNDAFAYAMLAIALAILAWRHGGVLVHPAFTAVLVLCAGAAVAGAAIYRKDRCTYVRAAPMLMLAGALVGAPAPEYRATETTIADLFAGEHVIFTGALVRNATTSAIVRYAITCCRADASPVVVRLAHSPSYPAGTWLRVEGTIENVHSDLRLVVSRTQRIGVPSDPFIYR